MALWRELVPSFYMQTDAAVSHFRAAVRVNSSESGRQSTDINFSHDSKLLNLCIVHDLIWNRHYYFGLGFYDTWKRIHTPLTYRELQCISHTIFLVVKNRLESASTSSLSFPISNLISSIPTKLMIPALSTMHEEKQKALSHLNGKYSEPLEKDKANIKNHKKQAYSTPMYLLHTDARSNFLY